MVSVVLCVLFTHLITFSSYIVDFEDCVVCETPDHFPNEYYISWRDTWFMCWGLIKYRPEPGEESDGSNFNDYGTPYSVVDPPSGHCPCHACAPKDRLACSAQLLEHASKDTRSAAPCLDKNSTASSLDEKRSSTCEEKSMPFSQAPWSKESESRKCFRGIWKLLRALGCIRIS
jgi:hypothetical protein